MLSFNKTVPDVSNGFYVNMRCVFYFTAESADMHIDRPVSAKIVFAPDLVEQSITGKYSTGMTGEKF